jgi:HEPN domain-containing protein
MALSSMSDSRLPDSPAGRWHRLAEEDLAGAHAVLRAEDVAPRIACFLAQQAAEKALKAGLIAIGRQFPKTHGLTRLLATYPTGNRPALDEDDLDALDPWVIDGRYAADLPPASPAEAAALVGKAVRVVEAVLPLLDDNPRPGPIG